MSVTQVYKNVTLIELPENDDICWHCCGTGEIDGEECGMCDGTGFTPDDEACE